MMDVDLLRPGTAPISPDTIFWFEFLLNPSLLKKHISKSLPDPTPTDLIIKFISLNSELKDGNDGKVIDLESNEIKINNGKKYSHKSIALKILSLKVAAYLNWDLDILEKKLPLTSQMTLLQDLFYVTGDINVEIPDSVPKFTIDSVSDQLLFTIVLYHRWLLTSLVNRALNNRPLNKLPFVHVPNTPELIFINSAMNDDLIRKLDGFAAYSIEVLNEVLKLKDIKPKMLTFDTFQTLTEDTLEIKQNWSLMSDLSVEEFKCQIHYDLATFHLLREEYQIAIFHIKEAKSMFDTFENPDLLTYCKVKRSNLIGYCLATNNPVEDGKISLTQQLLTSIKDQYENIIEILKSDNLAKEIPIIYRDNLELDIQGGVINRKVIVARDLLLQIQCLNLVRKIIDGDIVQGNYINEIKNNNSKGFDVLFWAIDDVIEKGTETDKQRIIQHLIHLTIMNEVSEIPKRIIENNKYKSLLNEDDLKLLKSYLIKSDNDVEEMIVDKDEYDEEDEEVPSLLLNNDWGIAPVNFNQSKKLKINELERRLILSYDCNEIREILILLDGKNPMNPPWRVNSRWEVPIPLQSVVVSLPRTFYQDYAYILLAKCRELMSSKNFKHAKLLLNALEKETELQNPQNFQNLLYKFLKLIHWEGILIDIGYYHSIWPIDNQDSNVIQLINECKKCLSSLQSADQLIPRQEIIENCTIFLLNMAEWDYLTGLEKRWTHCEFTAGISAVCQEIIKYKGSRKFPRETWDIILIAFGPNRDLPQKRSSSNSSSSSSNNSGNNNHSNSNIINNTNNSNSSSTITTGSKDVVSSVMATLAKLREPTALTVVISLLSRLHNVLRDESSLELHMQYLALWPASISNANSYNIRMISEYILQLLIQALKYYPTNVFWLRVLGDLNFILGYYDSAMKYYLQAIMAASDLFSQPVPRPLQSIYWRMIKCCAHLQCYTQATVLCQFLEEVNYSLAFKMASSDQKSCASTDAMDAYYHCIWDTTILEYLIQLHSKRGEHHRKQLAVKVIGLLELNSSNNEEIQREAANIRKAKFFRALAKQYVY